MAKTATAPPTARPVTYCRDARPTPPSEVSLETRDLGDDAPFLTSLAQNLKPAAEPAASAWLPSATVAGAKLLERPRQIGQDEEQRQSRK